MHAVCECVYDNKNEILKYEKNVKSIRMEGNWTWLFILHQLQLLCNYKLS
jgi:hypothetical protein